MNPFGDELCLANSCYLAQRDGRLEFALSGLPAPDRAELAHREFRSLVLEPGLPCVGAKFVVAANSYRFGWYPPLATPESAAGLCRDLFTFVAEQPTIEGRFSSYFAIFDGPQPADETQFESLLWRQLQAMHDRDRQHFAWDPKVSADPADPRFAFSVAGRAFFIVGMHAASSRADRRFAYPALIFNAQSMFDELRQSGQYASMQRTIRARTEAMGLALNPNLANFGEISAAREYSGRQVEADWQCPLRIRPAATATS